MSRLAKVKGWFVVAQHLFMTSCRSENSRTEVTFSLPAPVEYTGT